MECLLFAFYIHLSGLWWGHFWTWHTGWGIIQGQYFDYATSPRQSDTVDFWHHGIYVTFFNFLCIQIFIKPPCVLMSLVSYGFRPILKEPVLISKLKYNVLYEMILFSTCVTACISVLGSSNIIFWVLTVVILGWCWRWNQGSIKAWIRRCPRTVTSLDRRICAMCTFIFRPL